MEYLSKVLEDNAEDKLAEDAKKLMEQGKDILAQMAFAPSQKFKVMN